MILADRIIELRKKKGWSQEELAEMVDVTRQSVSKWESGQSLPDLDKILKLADIFGVSTDYLLKDKEDTCEDNFSNRKEEEIQKKEEISQGAESGKTRSFQEKYVTTEEVTDFLRIKQQTAPKVALGVSLCIISPIILILLAGAAEYGIINATEDRMAMLGIAILILIVAAAMAIMIPAGMKSSKYEYLEKEPITLDPDTKNLISSLKDEFQAEFGRRIALGVCLCVISVMPLFIAGVVMDPEDGFHFVVAVALLLLIVSVAVNIFVRAGIRQESYEKLLEEGDYTREEKDKLLDTISGIYWLLVTAIYLAYSFATFEWHRSWIIWPVAGVLYVIIREIYKAIKNK